MQLATSQAGKGDAASRFSIVIQAGSNLINRLITSTARIQVFCKTADYFRCGYKRRLSSASLAALTRKLGGGARVRGRLIANRSSAVRTIDIIYANHALALRTTRAEFVAAARAEVESRLNGT